MSAGSVGGGVGEGGKGGGGGLGAVGRPSMDTAIAVRMKATEMRHDPSTSFPFPLNMSILGLTMSASLSCFASASFSAFTVSTSPSSGASGSTLTPRGRTRLFVLPRGRAMRGIVSIEPLPDLASTKASLIMSGNSSSTLANNKLASRSVWVMRDIESVAPSTLCCPKRHPWTESGILLFLVFFSGAVATQVLWMS